MEVKPFAFEIVDPKEFLCSGIGCAYGAEVRILPLRADLYAGMCYCRTCLRRMRATLKQAEKDLPQLPKVARPRAEEG